MAETSHDGVANPRNRPNKHATVSKPARKSDQEPNSFSAFVKPRSHEVRKSQKNR